MDRQTSGYIIKALKNFNEIEDWFGDYYLNATADFLSATCEVPIEYYNKKILCEYIQSAFKDFMSTADSPRGVMYDFFESFNHNAKKTDDPDVALAHALCTAMSCATVREKKDGIWRAVNGFHVPADPKDDKYLKEREN